MYVSMYQSQWTDSTWGLWGQRSKVMGLIMYAKIACDRIVIRTDRQITIKLKTCMYLAEPMNWLDFRVMGLIMYAKIERERIIIRTNIWITMKLRTSMYLAEPCIWKIAFIFWEPVNGLLIINSDLSVYDRFSDPFKILYQVSLHHTPSLSNLNVKKLHDYKLFFLLKGYSDLPTSTI